MFSIHGTGIGGGIVIGRARVLESRRFDVARYHVPAAALQAEVDRLDAALRTVKVELRSLSSHLPEDAPAEARALIDVHAMILDDPMLCEAARDQISQHCWNAEWSVASQADELARQFEEFEDPYLRERGRDVQQVADRVLKVLSGTAGQLVAAGEPAIIVAADIAPGDMLALKSALGFAIDLGGTTSHTAILARSMNVPAVVGLDCASELIADSEWLIVDGDNGLVIVAPDDTVLAEYQRRQVASRLEREKLKGLIHVPARTRDGHSIELHANIELPEEAEQAREAGRLGHRTVPFRVPVPGQALAAGRGRAVRGVSRGRSRDARAAGHDPHARRRRGQGAESERRGVDHQSGAGPARDPLLPVRARDVPHAAARDPACLGARSGAPADPDARSRARNRPGAATARAGAGAPSRTTDSLRRSDAVGGMIEVPAAALSVGLFLRRLDFLSIGTNDLIQYTLAIDRADHAVAPLYDPFHPAVLRLIAMTIRAGRRVGKPVAVCGELAGDHTATRLLLGMGLSQFSMHPASLLMVKREILLADVSQLSARVGRLLHSDDPAKVRAALQRLRTEPKPRRVAAAKAEPESAGVRDIG